jgi:hypothetical protein
MVCRMQFKINKHQILENTEKFLFLFREKLMDNAWIFQKLEFMDPPLVFKNTSEGLSNIWNYSWIPLILERETFSELIRANELALKLISKQYKENHYENIEHPFAKKVSQLDDPEMCVVPFRIDYLKKENGTYAMYDLNTQPGIPGSYFWEDYWQQEHADTFTVGGKSFEFFRVFPVLAEVFKKISPEGQRVALFQEPDPAMSSNMIQGLSAICKKTSSYRYYSVEFLSKKSLLQEFDIIEPFYFIRGGLKLVFSNYEAALETEKPLGSNLKLEPYTSKDMAFARNLESYLDSKDAVFLKERIASMSTGEGVKKRLYGMSGSGYYEGDESVPWSDELVVQERLFPEQCLVSTRGRMCEMMYDVGITSLLVFKARELTKFYPVVDLTVRASETHPISGPHTHIVPAAVER